MQKHNLTGGGNNIPVVDFNMLLALQMVEKQPLESIKSLGQTTVGKHVKSLIGCTKQKFNWDCINTTAVGVIGWILQTTYLWD